ATAGLGAAIGPVVAGFVRLGGAVSQAFGGRLAAEQPTPAPVVPVSQTPDEAPIEAEFVDEGEVSP
ncbi:hypothetical protein, partial [Streptomyces sp. NPDC002067]